MAGADTQVFTHVSMEVPIARLENRDWMGGRAVAVGKPGGFWMAPELTWIGLISSRQSWEIAAEIVPLVRAEERFSHTLEFYEDVFRDKKIPDYVPGTPLKKIGSSTVFGKTHFVYQAAIPSSRFVETFDSPSPSSVYRLTAPALDAFLARVDPWYDTTVSETTPRYPKEKAFPGRLADYFRESLAVTWGGVFFDASLFTEELKAKHRWIRDTEIPSMCLWKPVDVLGLDASSATNFEPFLKAVLTLVDSKEMVATKLHKPDQFSRRPPLLPYKSMTSMAAWTAEDTLVMVMRKGKFVASAKDAEGKKLLMPGGRRPRGRTFRRKPKRRNKNGGRSTRKSKHGRD